MPSLLHLLRRQYDGEDNSYDDWWWSDTGLAVRYGLLVAVFGSAILFLIISYIHAQRRLRRGLPPLAYHRWLVRRQLRYPPNDHRYAHYQAGPGNGYPMQPQGWAPPPPAYNQWDAPPVYQPPQGASKAAADQNFERTVGESSVGGVGAPERVYRAENERVTQ